MTRDRLTFEGRHFQYHDTPMELQPFQRPYPPLWYPTHSSDSIRHAARQGFNFVDRGPAASIRMHVDLYRRTWQQHRNDPGRLNGHVTEPKLGLMCQMVISDTDEEALTTGRTAFVDFNHSIFKLWHAHDDHSVDALFDWDSAIEAETMICGSPQHVRAQVSRLVEVTGCNYVLCSFAWVA